MGLDVIVVCNCYREGKTIAPPSAQNVIFDEVGEPTLSLPYKAHEEEHKAFDRWKDRACPHRGMWYFFERFGNWTGVGAFTDMMELVGWDNFPALNEALNSDNAGITSPASAKALLSDIERFASTARLGEKACLIDDETGELLAQYIGHRHLRFQARGELDFELDMKGFVARQRKPGEELGIEKFRSVGFDQELLVQSIGQTRSPSGPSTRPSGFLGRFSAFLGNKKWSADPPVARFVDAATGREFLSHMTLERQSEPDLRKKLEESGQLHILCPRSIRVELRTATPRDFDDQLLVLMQACRASSETGNPIRWS